MEPASDTDRSQQLITTGPIAGNARSITDWFRIDRAVAVALAGKIWQSAAGLATLYVVIRFFSPATQGYFQTFLSLLALQAFAELGLLAVVVVAVSHEWSELAIGADGAIVGNRRNVRRLASIARFVVVWFGGAAALLIVGGGAVGILLLERGGRVDAWLWPWLLSIALAGLLLVLQSLTAILEGANRLFEVATFRLLQSILASSALWAAAAGGWGLWSLPTQLAVSVLCAALFLGGLRRRFFRSVFGERGRSTFSWRREIWPMQWQLALQGIAGYFTFSLFVPVLFAYHGAVEAGRMGLALQMMLALFALPATWLNVTLPRLGATFAKGDYGQFNQKWLQTAVSSTLFCIILLGAAMLLLLLASRAGLPEVQRFVPMKVFVVLAIWVLALHLVGCCATYWRAQKIELLGFWGVIPGTLTGFAIWLLTPSHGAFGAAIGAASASLFVMLPLCIFFMLEARSRIAAIQHGRSRT